MISIITPWHNCPELIGPYSRSNVGAELIIIDNASDRSTAAQLKAMVRVQGGAYIRNEDNRPFAEANNQGLEVATRDVILCLNNDTEAPPGWVNAVEATVEDGALYGPSLRQVIVGGMRTWYLEGYCIAATRATWDMLNGWDAVNYRGAYWEDNDLCFRALQAGLELKPTAWRVWHASNYTSARTPGAYAHSVQNAKTFEDKVRAYAEFLHTHA